MAGMACSLWLNLPLLRLKIISYAAPGVSTEETVSSKILHSLLVPIFNMLGGGISRL